MSLPELPASSTNPLAVFLIALHLEMYDDGETWTHIHTKNTGLFW